MSSKLTKNVLKVQKAVELFRDGENARITLLVYSELYNSKTCSYDGHEVTASVEGLEGVCGVGNNVTKAVEDLLENLRESLDEAKAELK